MGEHADADANAKIALVAFLHIVVIPRDRVQVADLLGYSIPTSWAN